MGTLIERIEHELEILEQRKKQLLKELQEAVKTRQQTCDHSWEFQCVYEDSHWSCSKCGAESYSCPCVCELCGVVKVWKTGDICNDCSKSPLYTQKE